MITIFLTNLGLSSVVSRLVTQPSPHLVVEREYSGQTQNLRWEQPYMYYIGCCCCCYVVILLICQYNTALMNISEERGRQYL